MTVTAATLEGRRTTLADDELTQLGAELRGSVLTPDDEEFAAVRACYNAMHPGSPALVVSCAGTADVIDAVEFARRHDLVVGVRGGGHSIAGLSAVDGALMLDLSPMRGVHVDVRQRLAHVQGGALWADVDHETQAFGLATPGGVVSDTGVAGLTLGGGYGWLRRKYALSCDNVVEAEVVCADGEVRIASEDSKADLFWALRGGGGNFGVVTSFTFRLHPLGPTVAFSGTFYPLADGARVLRNWRDYLDVVPDEVTSTCISLTFPPDPMMPEVIHNQPVMVIGGVYAGDPDEGMRALEPLANLGEPLFDMSQPLPYTAVQQGFDGLFPRNQMQAYWKSRYLSALTDEAIDYVADRALNRPSPITLVNLFHMGGALAEIDPESTAFAERSAPFLLSVDGNWPDPADNETNIAWVRQTFGGSLPFGTDSVYLNFTGLSGEDLDASVTGAFGRNLRRLREIKAAYDPANVFQINNNIAPEG